MFLLRGFHRIRVLRKVVSISCHRQLSVAAKFPLRSFSSQEIENEFNAIEDEQNIKFSISKILYDESKDNLLMKLGKIENPESLLSFSQSNNHIFKKEHFVQSVILLWDFARNGKSLESISENFLENLKPFISEMNPIEVSCCYLYLKKLLVASSHPTMEALLEKSLDFIKSGDPVPLSALSRLCIAVGSNTHFHIYMVCKDIIPLVERYLHSCETSEDLRLITICLQNLSFLTKDFLKDYTRKVESLISQNVLTSSSVKCIIRILNFLNKNHWSLENTPLIRKLMILIAENPDNLSQKDLETIFRVYQAHMEPAVVGTKLLPMAKKILETTSSPSILSYVVQFSPYSEREALTEFFKNTMKPNIAANVSDLYNYFQILRTLKTSDTRLCNLYWDEALKDVQSNVNNNEIFKAFKHCHRYMHFNNNLGGTYRHTRFEQRISRLAMDDLKHGISGIVPTKFAQLTSFVLAYGHTSEKNYKFPDFLVQRIRDMSQQFSIVDVFNLSRGIHIALEIRFKHHVSNDLATQLVKIESIFTECIERHLQDKTINLSDISMIVRSLNNRKSSRKTHIYKKAMEKYTQILPSPINSRLIRDITFNLNSSHFSVPSLMNHIFNYIVENKEYVIGDTVEKALFSAYNQGILNVPTNVIKACLEIIRRDFENMSGLAIVQSCLSLCFYRTLPEDLINKVFSVDFVKRIEDEIKTCYSKATYPERVLNQVMQLNRAVCLEFPEAKVPWFQQNYLEANLSRHAFRPKKINEDVKNYLKDVIKDDKYLRVNHVTPYGYRIDFLLHFDRNKQPIQPPAETTFLDRITKVAILLLKLDSFCENDLTFLKGMEHLRTRHLEMMGYKVVHINVNDWNSMYMNVPGVKTNYLKCLLQISDS
ncbi:hypothetical protein ACFFRR_002016 [Megaselia abdita]